MSSIPKSIMEMYPYLTRDENVKRMKTERSFFSSYIANRALQNYCDKLCKCANGGGERGD